MAADRPRENPVQDPPTRLVELVCPKDARFAVFRSFGEGLHGGEYHDPHGHVHGAPLRLRDEDQLG